MTPTVANVVLRGGFSPYRLPNIAARYSLDGAASDATYLLNGSNVALIADRSGNSAVNGLVLNGTAGNYASTPDSAAVSITGDIDLRVCLSMVSWTPSVYHVLFGKYTGTGNQRSYQFGITNTNGYLELATTLDGTAGTNRAQTSTVATGFAAYSTNWVRVTRSASTGTATFYTSQDGTTWTQLGATVASSAGNIYDGTATLLIGANNDLSVFATAQIYRAQVYNGIAGTLAFDADFTRVAKLASSFTESSSNAATVTIYSSGDLGARICGARDLVQLTASKQPAFSTSTDGRNIATYDGSNDYMASAPVYGAISVSSGVSCYVVCSRNGASVGAGGHQYFYVGNDSTYSPNYNWFGITEAGTGANQYKPNSGNYNGSEASVLGSSIDPDLTRYCLASVLQQPAGGTNSIYRNGQLLGSGASIAITGISASAAIVLGRLGVGGSDYLKGTISEAMLFTATSQAVSKVNRFLCSKWGIST